VHGAGLALVPAPCFDTLAEAELPYLMSLIVRLAYTGSVTHILREVGPDSLDRITKAQGTCARHAAQACFDALLASRDAGTEAGRRNRARLLSRAANLSLSII
jgi:hypothetical protein